MKTFAFLILLLAPAFLFCQVLETKVLIIGGGASGTMAGIETARLGVSACILEESPWLGGMLTAAGVTATDGNDKLPSGLWAEFRQLLADHYGSLQAMQTGWVSSTLFEPSVANSVLQNLARHETRLKVSLNSRVKRIHKIAAGWLVEFTENRKSKSIHARILIDATELGDVLGGRYGTVGAHYSTGIDSRSLSLEKEAPLKAYPHIIQDLTYVVCLKDYGAGTDHTIPRPNGYDPAPFACSCTTTSDTTQLISCRKLLDYGRLPNHKFMINWPECGNDFDADLIELSAEDRTKVIQKAKQHSLSFIYFLQTEKGYKNLGLADDEFPTPDKLPFTPYYRESRRAQTLSYLRVDNLRFPFAQKELYYRAGIAVGDYPLDHHYNQKKEIPLKNLPKIPSFNVPLGCLIPTGTADFIVAEKSIGVSNIANGATRLQPVVLLIGQAAGALAATCILHNWKPGNARVRTVQKALLQTGAYLMPYSDLSPEDKDFRILQRIGATGILRGKGIPEGWENKTLIEPDSLMNLKELADNSVEYLSTQYTTQPVADKRVTIGDIIGMIAAVQHQGITRPGIGLETQVKSDWKLLSLEGKYDPLRKAKRREIAILIDHYLHPFDREIDFNGKLK